MSFSLKYERYSQWRVTLKQLQNITVPSLKDRTYFNKSYKKKQKTVITRCDFTQGPQEMQV